MVSGRAQVTIGIFIPHSLQAASYRFRYEYMLNTFTLATQTHSLARYSKRTIQLLEAVSFNFH